MGKKILTFEEVIAGKWSSSGNFLGESKYGKIVHIYKKQMENFGYQGIITDAEKFTDIVKLPLIVLAYDKQFINRNDEQVIRFTAASIFKSYKDLIQALLSDNNLEAELEKKLNEINEKYSRMFES